MPDNQDNLSPENQDNLSPEDQHNDDPSLAASQKLDNQDPNAEPQDGKPSGEIHWYDSLESEDLKAHPKIKEFKSADAMAKSYLELHGLLGNEKMPIPKDEKDTAAIDMVNKILGVPEEASGYELPMPEPIQGMEQLQFGMDEFKAVAHRHKLTPKQAEGLMLEYTEMVKNVHKQSQEAYIESIKEAKNQLMQEWGLAYEPKAKLAQSVMNKFTDTKQEFDHLNSLMGADPVAIKWLAKLGENFSEGSLGEIGDHGSRFTKTPTEAKKEYDGIMNDPDDIYWAGVRNQKQVSESVRKERVAYVESLLRMSQPPKTS